MRKILLLIVAAGVVTAFGCKSASTDHEDTPHTHTAANAHDAPNTAENHTAHAGDHSSMQSSPGAAAAVYDLQFLDTMIAHHQGAIDMAKLALTQDGGPEVQNLSKSIIADQEREIGQMKQWREGWFAGKPAAMNMDMAGMHDSMSGMDMNNLGSLSGREFDLEFIHQMVPHHVGAVVMSKDALQKSQRPEIKSFANGIIAAQQKEIDQMNGWKSKWE